MANLNNHGQIIGRLAADPVHFINDDGSKRVFVTVYADRNFKNRDGGRDSDRIQLETWVGAQTDGLGIFERLHAGDLVSLGYTVRSSTYPDKTTGEIVYAQALRIEEVSLLESLATVNGRLAARLGAQQAKAEPAPTKTRTSRQKAARPA